MSSEPTLDDVEKAFEALGLSRSDNPTVEEVHGQYKRKVSDADSIHLLWNGSALHRPSGGESSSRQA